jgi:hypothetical protein
LRAAAISLPRVSAIISGRDLRDISDSRRKAADGALTYATYVPSH